jgi:hypothetical protein
MLHEFDSFSPFYLLMDAKRGKCVREKNNCITCSDDFILIIPSIYYYVHPGSIFHMFILERAYKKGIIELHLPKSKQKAFHHTKR